MSGTRLLQVVCHSCDAKGSEPDPERLAVGSLQGDLLCQLCGVNTGLCADVHVKIVPEAQLLDCGVAVLEFGHGKALGLSTALQFLVEFWTVPTRLEVLGEDITILFFGILTMVWKKAAGIDVIELGDSDRP